MKPQGRGFGTSGLGAGAKRGGSMRDQKMNKLNEERLEKERQRMKIANDNAKIWFGEIKRLLEQDDNEMFIDGVQVGLAK